MIEHAAPKVGTIIGPLGERITASDLPPPETNRWVARRKAEVVAAVDGGLLSLRDACERYHLSLEELASWQVALKRDGLQGLQPRKVQQNRQSRKDGRQPN
ncbi:CtrA inhibitor SciP [Novosphingobium chloroacetimidivorans]|uniref:CtrA inhibitor SciP n=1 Tax=Novosphingobium chloroacetimidivorans TaxID=1428314 RepID=UPI0016201A82|nr:DUF1153 domain-containing protein [Novosphingobium chloroacetimidivorans]